MAAIFLIGPSGKMAPTPFPQRRKCDTSGVKKLKGFPKILQARLL